MKTLSQISNTLYSLPITATASTVLIHGSYVNGRACESSDVDVLRIIDVGEESSEHINIDDLEFDIFSISRRGLEWHLVHLPSDNNSFLLRACLNGYVVVDRTCSMPSIRARASSIWNEGPGHISIQIRRMHDMHTENSIRLLEKAVRRGRDGRMAERFAWMRLERAFYIMLYRYHTVHGLWSQDAQTLIEEAKYTMPRLYEVCSAYLNATTLRDALLSIEELADACTAIGPIDLPPKNSANENWSSRAI